MKKIFILLPFWLFITNVQAQNIDIDADERVEWYREEQKIVAIGNAVAVKEQQSLSGNVLTMFYEKVLSANGTAQNQIQKISAAGNVKLKMPDANGSGDNFEYSMSDNIAVLKGSPAKLENKTGEITAVGSITYYGAENKSVALGDVIAQNPDYTVYADKMISYFDTDANGKKHLNRVEIYADDTPVKIVGRQSVVTGRRGTYFPLANKLKIFENVIITQNGDILKGNYAETDLKTGISRLLASSTKGSRVSGIFHSKKKKK